MNRAIAREIAEAIVRDVEGRKGLGDEWGSVDADVREEILETWTSIVEQTTDGYADNDRPKWDENHDENETCKCGHPYYRHFDTYEDMYPIGCKYCNCYEFESDPEGGLKYANEICCVCHGKLAPVPEENWCAKCGKVMEPWSPEVSDRMMREERERQLRTPPEVGEIYARKDPYRWGRVTLSSPEMVQFKPADGSPVETMSVVDFNTLYDRE